MTLEINEETIKNYGSYCNKLDYDLTDEQTLSPNIFIIILTIYL